MPFTFAKCPIDGLVEIQPKVFGDARGYFLETWSDRDFAQAGIAAQFVQDNQSFSRRGVLRGLHFQKRHAQAKLVRAVAGEVVDVAVDLRNDSPTFGKFCAVVLSAEKQNQFFIPAGFAHGFCVKSETAIFAYKCTDFYAPDDEGAIFWADEKIGIDWAKFLVGAEPLLSEKDGKNPRFDFSKEYFDKNGVWIGE